MTDLSKWPRLRVTGSPVTREQANEILTRRRGSPGRREDARMRGSELAGEDAQEIRARGERERLRARLSALKTAADGGEARG